MTDKKIQLMNSEIKHRYIEYLPDLGIEVWSEHVESQSSLWPAFPTVVRESDGPNGIPVGHPKIMNEEFYIG